MRSVLEVSPEVLARAFELTLRPWPSRETLSAEFGREHPLSPWAGKMIAEMSIVSTPTTIRVVDVTALDVDADGFIPELAKTKKQRLKAGMARCYSRPDLYKVFQARGFLTCRSQVGPELELSHPTSLNLQNIRVAMEPIWAGGLPGIFQRREGRGLWADAGGNTVEFAETSRWLVQLPS